MSRSAAFTATAALLALAGCFQINPVDSCRLLCTPGVACPNDMTCLPQPGLSQGLCVDPGVRMCAPLQGSDGGTDASAPPMLAHNGQSFTLPPEIRDNLVLLLWPDNLPPLGSPVPVWYDESGKGNDATALYPTAPPHVFADGVKLDPTQYGAGLGVQDSPSLDLGSGDFAIIVVAGLTASAETVTLFSKTDGARSNSRKLAISYSQSTPPIGLPEAFIDDTAIVSPTATTQPSVDVYGLRRTVDHVELRLNGTILTSVDVPPGTSTTNSENIFLGTANLGVYAADSIEAVLVVKGSIATPDLDDLEAFLRLFRTPS